MIGVNVCENGCVTFNCY